MRETILKILTEVLEENSADIYLIENDEDLIHYNLNSIKSIHLIIHLEDEFGIEVNDEDLLFENFNTVEKIINIIRKNQ
ncbi:acyl carrier protein [Paenibacillus solani]|uniref:acyl carrier protein n=1 Tax=Paenibacillus solani TaxID=1705565 RepID=UPI003D2B0478